MYIQQKIELRLKEKQEHLMPKTMKLLERAQITINKNTNCETPLLEILELVFVYYDIVNNSC